MLKNRLIYIGLIIGSGVFATFYGGNIPKMLFWFLLLLPVTSVLYTVLVYLRFRMAQTIPAVKVVKNQQVPYHFVMANEDFFPFFHMKIHFLSDYSKIEEKTMEKEFYVLPKERIEMDSMLCGKYRGSYQVGVNSIEITDFLCLFSIRYPIMSKLKIIVWPRVVNLSHMTLSDSATDSKNMKYAVAPKSDVLDLELRKYAPGDRIKLIHWKASAKKRELMTRKCAEDEKNETILYMDLTPVGEDERRIEKEDKIIEISLAIAKYYLVKKEQFTVMYDGNRKDLQTLKSYSIRTQRDFETFYTDCVNLYFSAEQTEENVIREYRASGVSDSKFYIFVSTVFHEEIYKALCDLFRSGAQITYFYVHEAIAKEDEKSENMIADLQKQGVMIYRILPEDEIEKVLQG